MVPDINQDIAKGSPAHRFQSIARVTDAASLTAPLLTLQELLDDVSAASIAESTLTRIHYLIAAS